MFKAYFLLGLFCCFIANAQVLPEKTTSFPSEEFNIYYSFTDSLHETLYQIGRHEPVHYKYALDDTGKWLKEAIKPGEKKHHSYAPIYLKTWQKKVEQWYFLDDYSEAAFYRIEKLDAGKLLFITARYHFYIFDQEKEILSQKINPSTDQYEGEDGMSGLYDGMVLFDNEKFLLGNVKSFGVFCFDISDPHQPKELKQYGKLENLDEQFYVFFAPNNNSLYDVIVGQVDKNAKHPNIAGFYTRLKGIRYVLQNQAVDMGSPGEPIVLEKEHCMIFRANKRSYALDLRTGTISLHEAALSK